MARRRLCPEEWPETNEKNPVIVIAVFVSDDAQEEIVVSSRLFRITTRADRTSAVRR